MFLKPFLCLLFLAQPILSSAEVILSYYESESSREYAISSDNCSELQSELNDFQLLTSRYDKLPVKRQKVDCTKANNTLALNQILPLNMLNILNMKPEYYGPNCWNSVLYTNKFISGIRFSSPVEFEKMLTFNQCQLKTADQKLVAGDIIRIFDKNREDFHAFVYITPNFSFSKNGPETRSRYEIAKTSDIFLNNYIDSNCFKAEERKISVDCADQVKVYNCQDKTVVQEKASIETALEELEARISFLILNYREFKTKESRISFTAELSQNTNTLYYILNYELINGKLSRKDFIKADLLLTKVNSIKDQISFF